MVREERTTVGVAAAAGAPAVATATPEKREGEPAAGPAPTETPPAPGEAAVGAPTAAAEAGEGAPAAPCMLIVLTFDDLARNWTLFKGLGVAVWLCSGVLVVNRETKLKQLILLSAEMLMQGGHSEFDL